MTGALEANVATRCTYLHHGTAAIQLAFGRQRLRSPPVALTADVNIGEIGSDAVSVPHIDAGPHIDGYIRRNVDRNIARTGFPIGLVPFDARVHQFHGDPARTRFSAGRRHAIQLDAATAGFRVNVPLGRGQVDAPSSGLDLCGTTDVTQIHAAAARRNFHFATTLAYFDAAAAGLNDRAL